jgi:hypothetical protein
LVPNFTDRRRPVFDTQGNALVALKSIWTNDPTGPLADDALMLTASWYARTGNFLEADRHFTLLRETFPNSPHVQKAFELGAHCKLMSYQGSIYDDKALRDAKLLKEATLRLYPETTNRERMESELRKIEHSEADRYWKLVNYYEGKRLKRSAAIYCHLLLTDYPKSPHADAARKKLDEYGEAYVDGRALRNPYPDPPRTLWTSIFPPDDHGGEPVIPLPPGSKPPPKYGAKFALIKPAPEDADQRTDSPRPKYGARLALVKPKPEKTAKPQAAGEAETEAAKSAPGPKNTVMTPPQELPPDDDPTAQPAPVGRARVQPIPTEETAEDDDAGHTRLAD